jgi:hypothetical protein
MAITIDGDSGVSGVNGSATTPALQGTDSNTGIVFGTDTVQIATGGSTRATVDSSGHLGLGTTSPTDTGGYGRALDIQSNSGAAIYLRTDDDTSQIAQGSSDLTIRTRQAHPIIFNTNNTERMQIKSDGTVEIKKSSTPQLRFNQNDTFYAPIKLAGNDLEIRGSSGQIEFYTGAADGDSSTERMRIANSGYVEIGNTQTSASYLLVNTANNQNAIFNRTGTDGTLVLFRHQGANEGSISVSGTTVSYNGAHLSRWSQLTSGTARTEILRGSVLSNLDEMCEWAYEAQDAVLYTDEDELPEGVSVGDVKTPAVAAGTEDNEQLNRMKVSDVEGDVNVAGVFQAWDDDDDTYTNDFYCAMTGDFVIRIAQGTTVARGDLLMSAGDGTAKPQDDDIVRSKTIAKVTSTMVSTTYSDGSYCVPCVLMAC